MSSILFGLVHLNPWQFITGLILGIFSGWVYYKTRKLSLSIFVHFVNNLFAFSGIIFTDEGTIVMNESLPELYGGLTNLILITPGALLVSFIGIFLLKKEFIAMKN